MASPRPWCSRPRAWPPEQGYQRVELFAREELAELVAFWQHRGFHHDHVVPHGMILTKPLPMMIKVPTSEPPCATWAPGWPGCWSPAM